MLFYSWSAGWGQNGYFLIERNKDGYACGITQDSTFPDKFTAINFVVDDINNINKTSPFRQKNKTNNTSDHGDVKGLAATSETNIYLYMIVLFVL